MINNPDLERQLLAGILKYPDSLIEIESFISDKDFYSEKSSVHRTIFLMVSNLAKKNEKVDDIVVAERIKSLGVKFEDDINVSEYVQALYRRQLSQDKIVGVAKELKKYTIRRETYEACRNVAKAMKEMDPSAEYSDIVSKADNIYNKCVNQFENLDEYSAVNIYERMEAVIEERGDNPVTNFGLKIPYTKTQDIYGSLLREGNITCFVARAGAGKTSISLDLATKAAAMNDVPIIHFDNGEMSEEEIIFRQTAALSGVPIHLLESGDWRRSQECIDAVRKVWPQIKKMRHYYVSIAGMSVDQMINVLKRTYYSKVGRGNKAIFVFDYIKTTGLAEKGMNEWVVVGEMVDRFKKCIQKEILLNNKPLISMLTSVQANRSGVVSNRKSENVVDDESIVALSDRISHFVSHFFILRKKTMDELVFEQNKFGTHKLINIKARHLGKDIAGALDPVQTPDGPRNNYLNFRIDNFNVQEMGDLRDIIKSLGSKVEMKVVGDNDGNDLPPELQ